MEASSISWRTTITFIITILQIQALISIKTTRVTGVEGQRFDFRCEYSDGLQTNAKNFCHDDDNVSSHQLIRTNLHDKWVEDGRFSLYDNTTGAYFIVRVKKLSLEDRGKYWCGVDIINQSDDISAIELNVVPATESPISPTDLIMDKLHLPLYLTAVMCVAAILGVLLFTLCLLMAIKHQRSGPPRQNREMSSDYETMVPGVTTEPELCCSCSAPDCPYLSGSPPPPPDLCSHFTLKNRESAVSLGLSDYVDVDVSGHLCQYQQLDLSRTEDHVYHSLHGDGRPKDGPLGVKEQIRCSYC
ncbi:uncharacterized protein [Pagrus major]|uniref:uncharacterized protein n=1 Tax=Pagrus major TaxID=143350 RepID=UPI003CC8D75F